MTCTDVGLVSVFEDQTCTTSTGVYRLTPESATTFTTGLGEGEGRGLMMGEQRTTAAASNYFTETQLVTTANAMK